MTEITTTGFDYDKLDEETAGQMRSFAFHGQTMFRKTQIQFIAEFGELLSDARKVLANHGDGTFIKWATSEFDLGKQTIYNYLNAWDRCLSNGWTNPGLLSVSALYLLTTDSTPSAIRTKTERLTAANKTVTKADVQRLIEAQPKPVAKPAAPAITTEDSGEDWLPDDDTEDENGDLPDTDDGTPDTEPTSTASIVKDSLGRDVPIHLRPANELGITLMTVGRELDKFRQRAKELHEQPGGQWIQLQQVDEHVRALKGHFQDAKYHTICNTCRGDGCQFCQDSGFVPEYRKNTVRA